MRAGGVRGIHIWSGRGRMLRDDGEKGCKLRRSGGGVKRGRGKFESKGWG